MRRGVGLRHALAARPRMAAVAARRPLRRALSNTSVERAAGSQRSIGAGKVELEQGNNLAFDHVQIYVPSLRRLSEYQQLEADVAALGVGAAVLSPSASSSSAEEELQSLTERWRSTRSAAHQPTGAFTPFGQDIVEQLIVGAGWRVCASHSGAATESVLIRSADPRGVRFVVTAPRQAASLGACMPDVAVAEVLAKAEAAVTPALDHFAKQHIDRFLSCHADRPGVAVLAFETRGEGTLDGIAASYAQMHAPLCVTETPSEQIREYGSGGDRTRVLEVYAYYSAEQPGGAADQGTVLRFVERATPGAAVLPGLEPVSAAPHFPDPSVTSAYSDHWVSNVVDRTGFLDTLHDTLGFTPKVDFNAGVVAAGEAVIESTVTGNTPGVELSTKEDMLINQQQVFLPTNNALSDVGHVALFIEQLGQGVQHLASRVPDLVAFIQRANAYREVTQRGLVFLTIPRSYYGRLTLSDISEVVGGCEEQAAAVLGALTADGLVDEAGIVTLDLAPGSVEHSIRSARLPTLSESAVLAAARVVERARYCNLYSLLRDHLNEEQYIEVVRNQILVDIQGEDCLYQIFTAPVLNAAPGEEAPFLEFIQRVCSNKCGPDGCALPVKPGCGGFGIRNFLTLFLSIEVSKASNALIDAKAAGDEAAAATAEAMVATLTSQLNVSNPVLTAISDAMTAEGEALLKLQCAPPGSEEAKALAAEVERCRIAKEEGNATLQAISDDYKDRMAKIRMDAR